MAAGKGTRMKHLTERTPKPLLVTHGKNLLEWKMDALPSSIDEIILVIGYRGEMIKNYFGDAYKGRKITYVHMPVLNGTWGALKAAEPFLKDRFIVMNGDDLYAAEDIAECIKHRYAVLAYTVTEPQLGAKIIFGEKGNLTSIKEKTSLAPGDATNTGLYVLDRRFFDLAPAQISDTEYGLPQTLVSGAEKLPAIVTVKASWWFPITSPEDIDHSQKKPLL